MSRVNGSGALVLASICLSLAFAPQPAAAQPDATDVPDSLGAIAIRFDMPQDGYATIALYTPNGQMLRPLAQLLELKKGAYAIRWDGMDLWGNPAPAGT